MALISTRDSAYDFNVKFGPSMCVAVVAFLTGEMAAQSFAYHAHGIADSDKTRQCKSAMHARSGFSPP